MDQGVWSRLCLAFFDLFCPPDKNSNRKVKKDWYYILSRDYKHHYRHLVRTPWYIYKFHGQNSAVVLSVPLTAAGEAVEQLLSRQQIATNQSLFDAMYTLYIEKETEPPEIKRGARGIGGGSMRRMGKFLKQFDLTYDLRAMTGIQIYELLPREFNRY